jgi:hypothetical protein
MDETKFDKRGIGAREVTRRQEMAAWMVALGLLVIVLGANLIHRGTSIQPPANRPGVTVDVGTACTAWVDAAGTHARGC